MPCYSPLKAFRIKNEDNTGYDITFKPDCTDYLYELQLPCGRCIGCRLERSRQWAIRCVHEAQLHKNNCFLTLTFRDQNLDLNKSLVKRDFQTFMKRLRKQFPARKYGHIGYFHCGEYGEKHSRPHHHACLFGFDFADKIPAQVSSSEAGQHQLFTSPTLDRLWGHGHAWIGSVTFESAAYVARYITKKITGKNADDYYGDRLPEYTTMSKKPAIGLNWIKTYMTDVYPHDEVILRGKRIRPARYYDKYLEKNHPSMFLDIKEKREQVAFDKSLNSENSMERLHVKHQIQLLRFEKLKRPYEMTELENPQIILHDNQVISYRQGLINETLHNL